MYRIIPYAIIVLFFSMISCQDNDQRDFDEVAEAREVLKSGQFEAATKALDSILVLNPKNIYALELKGLIYAKYHKDFKKAIEYYKRSELIYSGNALNKANIGRNYIKIGRTRRGKEYISKAYEINSNDEYIILQYAHFVLENIDDKIMIYEEAISSAKLKLKTNTYVHKESLGDIYSNIGYNLYLQKDFLKSAKFLKEGLSYGEENADYFNNLGNSLQRIDSLEQAIYYYDLALKEDPNKSYSLNGKANTYLRMGIIDSSCVYWKKTLESGYNFDPTWKEIWDIEDPELMISKFCKE